MTRAYKTCHAMSRITSFLLSSWKPSYHAWIPIPLASHDRRPHPVSSKSGERNP